MNYANIPQLSADENGHLPNLDGFFNGTGWRPFGFELAKKIGAYPNRLYFNDDDKLGAVVAFRGVHDTWALNEAAITYLRNAVNDGRIDGGYVILAHNNPEKVVCCMEVTEVAKRLDDVTCRDGKFGRYWWVNEKFSTDQSADLADAPF